MQQKINLINLDIDNVEHLAIMYTVRTHPEVDRYLRGDPPSSFDRHVDYLRKINPQFRKFYLVEVESALCGYCQLTVDEEHVEFGMALHPDFCNRGIGSAAMSLVFPRLQQDEGIKNKTVILYVKKDNPRAIALYQKLGFQIVGSENEHGEYLMTLLHHSP